MVTDMGYMDPGLWPPLLRRSPRKLLARKPCDTRPPEEYLTKDFWRKHRNLSKLVSLPLPFKEGFGVPHNLSIKKFSLFFFRQTPLIYWSMEKL